MSNNPLTITIKNIHLLDLKRWLGIPLSVGQLNRTRNEFLRMLKPLADELEHNRKEILKSHIITDNKGKQNLINPEFKTPEDKDAAEQEYEVLINEPVNVIITKPLALDTVKQILKTTDQKMGNVEGERFDEVCDAMEISFNPEPVAKKKA